MLRSHLELRTGISLIPEANVLLIPVVNKLQVELAAVLVTTKTSVLACAVIRSLFNSLNISSPLL